MKRQCEAMTPYVDHWRHRQRLREKSQVVGMESDCCRGVCRRRPTCGGRRLGRRGASTPGRYRPRPVPTPPAPVPMPVLPHRGVVGRGGTSRPRESNHTCTTSPGRAFAGARVRRYAGDGGARPLARLRPAHVRAEHMPTAGPGYGPHLRGPLHDLGAHTVAAGAVHSSTTSERRHSGLRRRRYSTRVRIPDLPAVTTAGGMDGAVRDGGPRPPASLRGTRHAAPTEQPRPGARPGLCETAGAPRGRPGQPKRSIRIRSTGWPAATSSLEACSAKELEPHT